MHNTSTKYQQMHDNWILIFICFVGRFLLEPSASSSSSFIIASFLIQELSSSYSSLLEGSSLDGKRLLFSCSHLLFSSYESSFFIFLIAWGISFGWWELDLQFLPSSLLFLWIELLLLLEVCWIVITSFRNTFLEWINPLIMGGHSRWLSQLMDSLLLLLLLQVVLWFERPL